MAFSLIAIQAGWHLVLTVKVIELELYGIFCTCFYFETDEKLSHERSFVKVGPLTAIYLTLMNFTGTYHVSWSVWVKFDVRDSTHFCEVDQSRRREGRSFLVDEYEIIYTCIPNAYTISEVKNAFGKVCTMLQCNAPAAVMLVGAHLSQSAVRNRGEISKEYRVPEKSSRRSFSGR
jgi:hypothetical protein